MEENQSGVEKFLVNQCEGVGTPLIAVTEVLMTNLLIAKLTEVQRDKVSDRCLLDRELYRIDRYERNPRSDCIIHHTFVDVML